MRRDSVVALVFVAALLVCVPASGEKMTKQPEKRVIELPKPQLRGKTSVEEAISRRRSVREFSRQPVTLSEIGQLLWAAQGITSPEGLRAAPSAGALYPLEVYVVAGTVSKLPAGIYRYVPASHTLVTVSLGDRRRQLAAAALRQGAVSDAPAALVFTAIFHRTTAKYGERGMRYVYMDLGHAAENVYLQSVSLGLGTVIVGAFDDEEVAKALLLPSSEAPLAIMPAGRLR